MSYLWEQFARLRVGNLVSKRAAFQSKKWKTLIQFLNKKKNVSTANFRVCPSSETRRKESCMFTQTELLRKCLWTRSFFSSAFHVVSALRKRTGNVYVRLSATFQKYGNAFFHPVHEIEDMFNTPVGLRKLSYASQFSIWCSHVQCILPSVSKAQVSKANKRKAEQKKNK